MNKFIENLSLKGMNVKETMSRFMGDEELFTSCFKQFSGDSKFAELGQALKDKDYDKAFKAAHSLKGVAGNLGLNSIYEPLSELVELLRSKNYDADLNGIYAGIIEQCKAIFEQK